MKISNFWLLIILSLTITSCAILSGQSPEKVKKNNTFYIYSNVEGAKIEVLNKPDKENFEPTNAKSGSGFYSVNTYSKLRLGRTKLLISKEGYEPDTIKIRRASRPGVLTADICFFGPLVLLDVLCPDFYKISKKTSHQNVYLSATQEFMRLKYKEISKKSEVSVFDNFISEFPNSDCVKAAKSRRDSIFSINKELKETYVKAVSTKNTSEAKEFLKNYKFHSLTHPDLLTNETKNLFPEVSELVCKDVLYSLAQIGDETRQFSYIEETISDLKQLGIEFRNTEDFILTLLKNTSDYNGEIQLYGQKITSDYLMTWLSNFNPYGQEKKDFEETKLLLSTVDEEEISLSKGKIKSISGKKNGNLIFRIIFSKDICRLYNSDYYVFVKGRNEKGYKEAKEQGAESEDGFRFDNILLQVFLEEKSLEMTDELKNVRFVEYFCPEYGNGGAIEKRIRLNYNNGFVVKTLIDWNYQAEKALTEARKAEYLNIIGDSRRTLHKIISDLKSLQLAFGPRDIIKSVIDYEEFNTMIEKYSKWEIEVNERYFLESNSGLPRNEFESGKQEKSTNFCYEEDYTGNKYELKLYNKEKGEGKVIYNLYKNGNLVKTITGQWKEEYVSFGDATNVVIDWDGANSGLGQTKYLIRKYSNGAWQDLQEFDGEQRIWTYCK